MSPLDVLRHPDAEALAQSVAARTITTLVEAQAATGSAHLCLTGGRIGTAVLACIAASPARDAVDWTRVDVWWGDERYLPVGHPDRNDTAARAVLLDPVGCPATRIHPWPSPEQSGDDVDAAAEAYADELAAAAGPVDRAGVPAFDVLLLSIGPDGHVASLFPEQATLHDTRPCAAVRGAPKPPPTRVTLTFPSINAAQQVWVLASGAEKAPAVLMTLTEGAGPFQVPAAGVHGVERTLLVLDEAAASLLPASLGRPTA